MAYEQTDDRQTTYLRLELTVGQRRGNKVIWIFTTVSQSTLN